MTDIFSAGDVEIVVRADSKIAWVNVDGVCVLRICDINKTEHRKGALRINVRYERETGR